MNNEDDLIVSNNENKENKIRVFPQIKKMIRRELLNELIVVFSDINTDWSTNDLINFLTSYDEK